MLLAVLIADRGMSTKLLLDQFNYILKTFSQPTMIVTTLEVD